MAEEHAPARAFCNKQCQIAHHYSSIKGVLKSDDDPTGDIQLTKEEEARAAYFTENNQQWNVKSAASKRIIAQFLKDPSYNISTTAAANDIFLLFDVLEDVIPLMIPDFEKIIADQLLETLEGLTGWAFVPEIDFSIKLYLMEKYMSRADMKKWTKECVLLYHASKQHFDFLNRYIDESKSGNHHLYIYAIFNDNNGNNDELVKKLVSIKSTNIHSEMDSVLVKLETRKRFDLIEVILGEYVKRLSPEIMSSLEHGYVVRFLEKYRMFDLLMSIDDYQTPTLNLKSNKSTKDNMYMYQNRQASVKLFYSREALDTELLQKPRSDAFSNYGEASDVIVDGTSILASFPQKRAWFAEFSNSA